MSEVRVGHIAALVALLAMAMLASACSPKLTRYRHDLPALQLSVLGQPGLVDGRQRFREVLCGLRPDDCESLLIRLADEPVASSVQTAPAPIDPALRVIFVPGAFQACFPEVAVPFEGAFAQLRSQGHRIDVVRLGARSSSERNAEELARIVIADRLTADEKLVLIGHSKGVPDILVFLARYPVLAEQVSVVVSIAGAVNGTRLADWVSPLIPLPPWFGVTPCEAGDGGVLQSLRHEERMRWWSKNRLPDHIRYFSLGAVTTADAAARIFDLPRQKLARASELNDGQLLFFDQAIPGSTLLGYANADHWDVVLGAQQRWSYWAANRATRVYPRDALFEALMRYLSEAMPRGAAGLPLQ
jgi:hypothetical protein